MQQKCAHRLNYFQSWEWFHLIFIIYLFTYFKNKFIDLFIFKINLFIYLFLAALGLHCCALAFSSCGEQGLLFVVVHVLLIVVASLVVECGL